MNKKDLTIILGTATIPEGLDNLCTEVSGTMG